MFTKVIVLAALSTCVLAAEFYSPAHFGAMMKRQGGYAPDTERCGKGDTCEVACGVDTVQCPSEGGLYCYDPTVGEQCCPDGTGNACEEGYYCSSNSDGTTYCCPDDSDLSDCAASYSLTDSLSKETGSVDFPSSTSVIAVTTTTTHITHSTYVSPASTSAQPTGAASKKKIAEGLVVGLVGLVAAL